MSALLRYNDAAQEKPGDVAIHVRLGRVFERLGQLSQAIKQYSETVVLHPFGLRIGFRNGWRRLP